MSEKVFDKICVVCGDRAKGFHFDVITCESCKSFFRRNALKNNNLKCYLGGNCQIDAFNRTFCKKCRLNKCFSSGMKTEFILSEEQRTLRKSIIDENRRRKFIDENNKIINLTSNLTLEDFINEINTTTHKLVIDYSNGYNSSDSSNQSISSSVQSYSEPTLINFENIDFSNFFQESIIPIQRPITDYCNSFNELEGNRLTELLDAIQYMNEPIVTKNQIICNFLDAVHVMHQKLDIDIRKLVKMAKKLTAFRAVCESDQIVLLKFASIEIIIIRMLLYFNFQFEYWTIITNDSNQIKLELFKGKNTYENHKHFFQSLGPDWGSDPVIIDLLSVILLFNPNRPKLNNRSIIKLQQQIYIHLLNRYLLIKYRTETESKSRLTKIMKSLTDIHILNEKVRSNILQFGSYVEVQQKYPLLLEICDRDALALFLTKDGQIN